jgi:hypothetical protein
MDELGAPWNLVRKIAHARGAAAQWDRAIELLGELALKRGELAPRVARIEATRLAELRGVMAPTVELKRSRRSRLEETASP